MANDSKVARSSYYIVVERLAGGTMMPKFEFRNGLDGRVLGCLGNSIQSLHEIGEEILCRNNPT